MMNTIVNGAINSGVNAAPAIIIVQTEETIAGVEMIGPTGISNFILTNSFSFIRLILNAVFCAPFTSH